MTTYIGGSKGGHKKANPGKSKPGVGGLKKKLKPKAVGKKPNSAKSTKALKAKIEKRKAAGKKTAGAAAELKARRSNASKSTAGLKKKIERRKAAGKKTTAAQAELKSRRKARRNAVPLKKAGAATGPKKGSGIIRY